MITRTLPYPSPNLGSTTPRQQNQIKEMFISEMLKHIDSTEAPESFSGGIGESQFESFLLDEYAKELSQHINFKFT